MKIEEQLSALDAQRQILLQKLDEARANKRFLCGCGRTHRIKDCMVIQTHWYESPHGCMGGDNWHQGELQIICPLTDSKSRLFFDSRDKVEWSNRDHYAYNAEAQFKRLYLHLFKGVIKDYEEDKRSWWNIRYFDEHRRSFGLRVEGIDKWQ